jgi:hypothetical protein
MKERLRAIYYFLPVQLVLLHLRKYQPLLLFWLIIALTCLGQVASHFGALTLFLAPEYLGSISFLSMLLLGAAMGIFIMTWHITTFIIHSRRIPFIGATRHAFLIYCLNNSIIPLAFLVFYSIVTTRFLIHDEKMTVGSVAMLLLGFYFGLFVVILISFTYFFRVSRDLLKVVLSRITNPARIREIIPYDALDYEMDIVYADTFLSDDFKIVKCRSLTPYHPRLLNTILRRHHRNAIFATFMSYLLLLLLGAFMNEPILRIPAGASFLIFFSIIMGLVGAIKYFLKSWETIGWVVFAVSLSLMVHYSLFDLRSIAYGLDYHSKKGGTKPKYEYTYLRNLFSNEKYEADKAHEEQRLQNWLSKFSDTTAKPPLIVLTVSGGGLRSAYWVFRSLQYIDSASHGRLFNNMVLITGASGGMIGASYWRGIHDEYIHHRLSDPYNPQYLQNVGKDLLNPIVFSLASVDLISPFNKISIAGYSYTKDRGYAMEEEMITNTDGILNRRIGDYRNSEGKGQIPQLIVNSTIIDDGRKLMMSGQPISFLCRPQYSLADTISPPIDAIDFATFFAGQDPYNLRLTSALRMNATFPFILPVVKLPSDPYMDIMDAGLRDNFGSEVASRYIYTMRDWLLKNTREVIFLEIRDTQEFQVMRTSEQNSFGKMILDPLFVIQNKWEAFQSYYNGYLKDYAPYFMNGRLRFITLQYVPKESQKAAALNFHLTQKEKEDIYYSTESPENRQAIDTLLQLLH